MQVTLSEKNEYIKMCMIYKQCNYSILLLLYDFEFENVEIKQTWNLKLENMTDLSDKQAERQTNKPVAKRGYLKPPLTANTHPPSTPLYHLDLILPQGTCSSQQNIVE